MAVQSYLTSYLAMREAVLGEKFTTTHAGTWLVWEPGSWKPNPGPAASTYNISTAPTPGEGDALCFQLGDPQPAGRSLRVGRETTCDVVIEDGTVSRHHLTFHATEKGWELEVVKDLALNGQPLARGLKRRVPSGSLLLLGGVRLTLLENPDLRARLREIVRSLKTS